MAFLGMKGTGDFTVTGQRPENWRETILYLYPNGKAPLTAIMSMLSSESVNDPKYHWYQKAMPDQSASVTGVYTDSGLSVAYTSAGAAGDTLYIKMSAADESKFRVRHQVLLRDASHSMNNVNAKVTAVTSAGASSYLTVKLLEADDNGAGYSVDLSDCDTCWIIGNINEEGTTSTDGLMYDPEEFYNYTQIFRTPLSMTRTATKTRLRTGDQVKQAKKEALELHSIEMEKAFLFGERSQNNGTGGKPERTTRGIRYWLTTNVADFTQAAGTSTWLDGGEEWLDNRLEEIFRYGSTEKLALCGSGALLGIQKLVKNGGSFDFTAETGAYGIKVTNWVTPFGTLKMKTHPLFTLQSTLRNSMCIVDPSNITYRYIDDTKYNPEIQANDLDGTKSEYLTECGLELHHESTFGWLDGIGQDNP